METKEVEKQQNGFLMRPHPLTKFEIQIIIRMKLNLMVFILEMICLE